MPRKKQPRSSIDTPEYRRQRAIWYAKLKEEGFEDQEMIHPRTGLPGDRMRGVSAGDLRRSSHRIQYVRGTERFYAACRAHLHTMPAHPRLHRIIFGLYAEGWRYKEIHEELERRMDDPPTLYRVTKICRRIVDDVRTEALREDPFDPEEEQNVWGVSQGWDS